MTNVLITGAFGSLGGRIAEGLSGIPELDIYLGSRSKRAVPFWCPSAKMMVIDTTDRRALVARHDKIDVVIHLASASEMQCRENPVFAAQVNLNGTINTLDYAEQCGANRFIYFSTSQVYGPMGGTTIRESSPISPQNVYAETHAEAEEYVCKRSNIFSTILRCSNVVGPPASFESINWTNIANDVCAQVLRGTDVVLKSSGLQHRSFVSINDVVNAVKFILFEKEQFNEVEVFNLGEEKSRTVYEMADTVSRIGSEILQKAVQIHVGVDSVQAKEESFIYSTELLRSAGFKFTASVENAITDLFNVAIAQR